MTHDDFQISPRAAELLQEYRRAPYMLLDYDLRFRTSLMNEMTAPGFEVEAERFRSILTVSGGALVASISIFQFLVGDPSALEARWLLGASWVLFGVAILGTLGTLRHVGVLRTYALGLYSQRGAILAQLEGIEDDAEAVSRMSELVEEAVALADKRQKDAARRFSIMGYTGAYAFMLAFVAFLSFAILNLY